MKYQGHRTFVSRNDCGKCKNGGVQCGSPMQKWCMDPKSGAAKKGQGCPGIQGAKNTLSSTGGPCYYDLSSNDCAVCKNNKNRQCGPSSKSNKCGNFCAAAGIKRIFFVY